MKNKTHLEKYRDFLQGESKSEATIYNYISGVKYFLSYIGKDADKITTEDIRKYKTHMVRDKGYKNNSLIVRYASIKSFYEYMEKPLGKKVLKFPKRQVVNKEPLTEREIQRLFEASKENKRNHSILKVLYYTGLRKFEVVNLNTGDIDTEKGKLYVYEGKGGKDAVINIHPEAIQSIKEYMEIREPRNPDEKALFLNQDGNRLGRLSLQTIVKKYGCLAGITKRIYPHLIRISMITIMSENGCSLEEIRKQSRHSDYKVLIGYIRLSDEHTREAYMKGISPKQDIQPKPEIPEQDIIKPQETTPIPKQDTLISKQEPQIQRQETPTPRQDTNQTNKYIQLLRKGEINKDEFLKLTSGNKMETDTYIY